VASDRLTVMVHRLEHEEAESKALEEVIAA